MAQRQSHNTNPAESPTSHPIETAIAQDRTRFFPGSTRKFKYGKRIDLNDLDTLNRTMLTKIQEVGLLVATQNLAVIGSRAEYLMIKLLTSIDPFVITASAGSGDKQTLGFSEPIGSSRYLIALALTEHGRELTKYEIAGVLFHELTHAADFNCDHVEIEEYREVYMRYSRRGLLDPFYEEVLVQGGDETELMARAFQGALFGSLEPSKNKAEFDQRVSTWHSRLPDMLELVEKDFYSVFADTRNLQTKRRIVMTTTQTSFRPLKPWEDWREMRIFEVSRPVPLDPTYRGLLLWLREQALQAEKDPSREWDGFRAEWEQLLDGTHPDPHPELTIYGHPVDNFDPTTLQDPMDTIWTIDYLAYSYTKNTEKFHPELPYPPHSQQLYAAICRRKIESSLNSDTNSTTVFED